MAKKKTKTRKQRKAEAAAKRQAVESAQPAVASSAAKAPVRKAAAKRPVRKQPNAIQRFFRETKGELQKVSWPTRDEAWRLTVVVTAVTIFMAAFLGFFDWVFTRLFALILG